MYVATQRRIDRILGRVICFFLSLFCRSRRASGSRTEPRCILVILLSEMGSLVLAAPMFQYLRKRYPQASLYILTFERNTPVLDVLGFVPPSRVLSVNGESAPRLLLQSLGAVFRMRRLGIDTVLDGELFSRISSIYSFLSGARLRVGFDSFTQEGLYRGRIVNRPVLYNPYRHISEQFITLARSISSCDVPPAKRALSTASFPLPVMIPEKGECEAFGERLLRDFPAISGKRLVLLYPGGGLLPIRAWPLSYFMQVARGLTEEGYAVGVIGMREDGLLAERIAASCAGHTCVNLAGYTRTVRELMVLFHLASLLITNDGGPGHFASLTPIPAILLFGPETPQLYGSLDAKAVNLYASFSCSPCLTAYNHRNSPCNGDNRCLKSILPEEVLAKAHEILL